MSLVAVATPGHAAGHRCYLLEDGGRRVLVAGGLVFHGGRISLLSTWDCDLRAYAASLSALDGARVDALLPGHHGLSLRDGRRHVDTANRLLSCGLVPPSLV